MNNAKTIITTVIVFALLVQHVSAKEKDLFLSAAGGISHVTLQDKNFSALPYTGLSWLTSLNLTTETAAYIDDLSLLFRNGRLAMDINSDADVKTTFTGGNIYYVHMWRINKELTSEKHLFMGGNFSSSIGIYRRSHYGDNYYYLYQSSIGPSLFFRHFFTESGRLQVCGQADFSLAAYVIYPSYGSNMPGELLDKELSAITPWDYVTGGKLLTVNKFQRINFTTSLTYGLGKRWAFRLGYNWDFFHLKREDSMIQAIHNAHISIIFH